MKMSERVSFKNPKTNEDRKITREEIKRFTEYDKRKAEIDSITGQNNLDFPYSEASLCEYCVRITLLDGRNIFLPITLTDGEGLHADDGFLRRPLTIEELGGEKGAKVRKKAEEVFRRKQDKA